MAKKKASKKKPSKKASKAAETSPVGDVEAKAPVTSRTLKVGTVVRFPGGSTDIVLGADVPASYPNVASDEKFAGMLTKHKGNFELNIGSLEGVWSPITGRREE